MRRFLSPLVLLCLGAPAAAGQSLGFGVSALVDAPEGTVWSLGYSPRGLGPFDVTLGGVYYAGAGRGRWGGSLDVSLFRAAVAPWYLTGGVQAGIGTGDAEDTWSAWSAGLGYRLLRVGPVALALEARYLHLSAPDDGLVLGAHIRVGLGRRGRGAGRDGGDPVPVATAIPTARSPAAQAVIQTALDMMGTPYAWGGTSENGFDCSGLIQYAYQAHGYQLPRRSTDQARAGRPISREIPALLPGDILTFTDPGGAVSHVGLYLGGNQFIHSASAGVQVSRLSAEDPSGSYWWRRWSGARRILPDPELP